MATKNIVFIDMRVSGYETLVAGLSAGSEWYLLDVNRDGVEQMRSLLNGRTGLDAIQVVSHGSVGTLYLGSTVLNLASLSSYQHDLQAIGASLSPTGDVLLYGCNVAQGIAGSNFVTALAQATGADVAASNDLTSGVMGAGNQQLEVASGVIESSQLDMSRYAASLGLIEGSSGNDIFTLTSGNDTVLGGVGTDISIFQGNAAGYRFELQNGYLQVVDINTTDGDTGTDLLQGIEILRFADRDYAVGQGVAGTLGETRVNTTTLYNQVTPAITALASGGYVVTWQSFVSDGRSYDIYAQRYDASGTAQGSETRINTTTAYHQITPAITALASGGYVVTWQSGNNYDIYAQRYDASGTAQGSETRINTTVTTNSQTTPAITALVSGGYVVTWQSFGQDGSAYGIYAQSYDASGTAQGSETRVNTTTAGDQSAPAITALAGGGYVISWQSLGQDGSGWGIYAQRYDSTGTALGGETRINTTTAGAQSAPAITALANAGYVVTWQSYDGGSDGIYAQRYDSTGAALGSETCVNTTKVNTQSAPVITGMANGDYIITWNSFIQDGSGGGIYAQRYDVNGQPYGLEITGTAGTDVINGGAGVQWLYGGAGDDTLDGGSGVDVMRGGDGNDVYIVDDASDQVIDTGSGTAEIDVVRSSASYTLSSTIEYLVLTGSVAISGTGNDQANRLTGNAASNRLTGGAGNDTLDGGIGADQLIGGTGDDVYIVDNAGDVIIELIGDGSDTVISSVTRTLGAYQNHLTLSGVKAINGTGNEINNTLQGNAAANTLDGMAGIDHMSGGLGNDTYIVDNLRDVVVETSTLVSEIDTIKSSVSFQLGANQENLWLTGNDAINATGNDLNNLLSGNGDENILNGMAGVDTVSYEDATSMVQVSLAITDYQYTQGDGFDLLINIENLKGSAFNDHLTGNALSNRLEGGDGIDTLIGGDGNDVLIGGDGGDLLQGGSGHDIYYFTSGDVIIEASTAPTEMDTVVSASSYRLGTNLEKLILTGSAAVNATGNELDNTLSGNISKNILAGGAGSDHFVFNTSITSLNFDTLADFKVSGADKIVLDDDIYTALGISGTSKGVALTANKFQLGVAADDAGDRIIYDQASGRLYYDADGNTAGGVAAIQIALIGTATHATLAATDFLIVS